MSPILLNIYKREMVEEIQRAQVGVKLEVRYCRALMYVDGIVLVVNLGDGVAYYVGGGSSMWD